MGAFVLRGLPAEADLLFAVAVDEHDVRKHLRNQMRLNHQERGEHSKHAKGDRRTSGLSKSEMRCSR